MSEIKTIETGKVTLLAVKVPDGAHSFELGLLFLWYKTPKSEVSKSIAIPQGNWQIIALSTEITEEQARELVPEKAELVRDSSGKASVCITSSSKQLLALLQANQCFSVNPYPKDWISYSEWKEAEANTGNWIILRRL